MNPTPAHLEIRARCAGRQIVVSISLASGKRQWSFGKSHAFSPRDYDAVLLGWVSEMVNRGFSVELNETPGVRDLVKSVQYDA